MCSGEQREFLNACVLVTDGLMNVLKPQGKGGEGDVA